MRGRSDSPTNQPAMPDFSAEARLAARYGGRVAGIDEAGRGPWAGPVVAAAVILDPDRIPSGVNDSKLLQPEMREALYDEIVACAAVGVGIATVARIDRNNILQATLWAMRKAVAALAETPAAVLVDGKQCPPLPCPAEPLVNGDGLSSSVAAASIIAKVTRDRLMTALARQFPDYGWERNKGYGTPEHAEALLRCGVTRHHRRSFKPVRDALEGRAAVPDA